MTITLKTYATSDHLLPHNNHNLDWSKRKGFSLILSNGDMHSNELTFEFGFAASPQLTAPVAFE